MIAAVMSSLTVVLALGSVGAPAHRTTHDLREQATDRSRRWMDDARFRFIVIALGVAGVFVVFGPLLAAGGVAAAAGWPRLRRVLASRALQSAIDIALPDAIEMLILVVHAGMTPHQAIDVLTTRAPRPTRPAFVEVRHRTSRGAPLADALHALPEMLGPGVATLADTLSMAERYGTPIERTLEQLSVDVRERRLRQAEADARKLPVRMSFPLVVCTLPSFVLVAIVPAVLAALASLDTTGF